MISIQYDAENNFSNLLTTAPVLEKIPDLSLFKFNFAIFCGGGVPRDVTLAELINKNALTKFKMPSLHIMGQADQLVPIARR